jgi:hypothetical protein
MGYLAVWKVLEQMIADYQKKGKPVPSEVMNDLKSAKTTIQIAKAETHHAQTIGAIEQYLTNVESYLVSEGQKQFGNEYVEHWLSKLEEAGRTPDKEDEKARFVSGIPRQDKWVRVKPTTELPMEKIIALARESKLSHRLQENGHLIVFGKGENVKDFVKKMTTKHGLKRRK